jgi:hypothetical protein
MDWELTLDLRERLILYDFVKSDVPLIRVMCNLAIPHPNPRSHMTQKHKVIYIQQVTKVDFTTKSHQ